MPSVSKSQQRLFGMVHTCQKSGDCASPEVKKIAKGISYKDADDFASTKHKGLPEKKKPKKKKKKDEIIEPRIGISFKEWFYQAEAMGDYLGSEQDATRKFKEGAFSRR